MSDQVIREDGKPNRFSDWTADMLEGMTAPPRQCDRCARRWADTASCDAYPQGIPVEILAGEHDHRRRFPGDGGILFKPRDRQGQG